MSLKRLPGHLIESVIDENEILFFVNDPEDHIQQHHYNGEFYEREELAMMAAHMDAGTRYVDIGANIGNHIIWLCKYIGLTEVLPIEPNPKAIAMLKANVRLNNLHEQVDFSCLGYGLSNRSGRAVLGVPEKNLGGGKFMESSSEGLPILTGDELLAGRQVDFVKIDVEGMELECLEGLVETITRLGPTIFIEVDDKNNEDFLRWVTDRQYTIVDSFRRYTTNTNYLLKPSV